MEWIKDNDDGVLNSKLNDIFDLNKIDWDKVEEFALSNLVKIACSYKKNSPEMTTTQIGEIMNLSKITVKIYLKQGNKLGWCNYNAKEELKKSTSINGKMNGKPVEIFKNGISLGIFPSCIELERQSENLFGVKLNNGNMSMVCKGKHKHHKGYTFKYISTRNN